MNKKFLIIPLTVFVLLALIRVFNIAYPVDLRITNSNVTSELSVVGEGKVDVKPNTARMDASITVSRAKTAADANERMAQINNAIVAAVKSLGINEADITTSNFSIYPEYDYNAVQPLEAPQPQTATTEESKIMPQPVDRNSKIAGYSGTATTTIKVRNTAIVSHVIEKVTAAGANNVGTPQFTVENPEKYREEARNKAIANAKEQANKLAKELGIRLGKITNFVEGGAQPYPVYDARMNMGATAKSESTPPTIEEGTQTVTSTVTLYFERK
jgi:uncharacterized protein YggE